MKQNFYPSSKAKSNKALVFVGGDGDTKDDFTEVINHLSKKLPQYSFCAFTYSNSKKNIHPLDQTIIDLKKICDYLVNKKNIKEISLFCTSMGAYSTCHLLISPKYNNLIKEIIFCDPADYYLPSSKFKKKNSWSGFENYQPEGKTVSSLLLKIKTNTKIHVIHFLLRNYGLNGYPTKDLLKRGEDNPSLFPRLNTHMVKTFYQNLPQKNRGLYIEDHQIPHGFNRDGNHKQNQQKLTKLILSCFKS